MSVVKTTVKSILWNLLKRNYILLRPGWTVVNANNGYSLIGPESVVKQSYLPVRYNYHTPPHWVLRYNIRGQSSGVLTYKLGAPGERPFCRMQMNVQLPFNWTVMLDALGLDGNGIRIPIVDGMTIPRSTMRLVGEFVFQSDEKEISCRKTGHRIRLDVSEPDDNYFNGIVYDSYVNQDHSFLGDVLETIGKHHPLSGRLLDVGCATGFLVEYALKKGLDAEGVDRSEWAIEKAKVRTGGRCRVLDFDAADNSDFNTNYDIIILYSVLEHFADPARALRLLSKICRPGGVIYIHTLNADSLMHLIMKEDWEGYSDHTHFSPWITADWLSETVASIGFEILDLRRYFVWNDNNSDEVWRQFASILQTYPASVVLEDHYGDVVELIMRSPL